METCETDRWVDEYASISGMKVRMYGFQRIYMYKKENCLKTFPKPMEIKYISHLNDILKQYYRKPFSHGHADSALSQHNFQNQLNTDAKCLSYFLGILLCTIFKILV